MIFRWIRIHLAQTITWASGGIVVALIATLAVVSGGYTAQRMDLGDAAVWVANESRQIVGRANTALRQLNTVVTSGGTSLDVVQSGSNVLVIDRTSGSLDIIDPATAAVTSSVPLPPVAPAVHLTASNAVITSDGDVWSVPVEALDGFNSAAPPMLSLGTGAVTSVDASGVLFSFTPSTGNLSRADTAHADTVSAMETIDAGASNDTYELTSVAGNWALLNTSTQQLFMSGIQVDLAKLLADGTSARLQSPSVSGDRVLIAHRGGLIAIGLDGGDPRSIVTARDALPAAPVVTADCAFAAWTDGAIWRSCENSRETGGALDENDAEHTEGTLSALDSLGGDARLEFQQNGSGLLLNDARGGAAWAVQADNQLIDNWAELIDNVTDQEELETNRDDTPPELEKVQVPPVAVDDAFGARPGRASVLPVLQNDYDANGDALVVSAVTGFPEDAGRLDLISNGQQVQVTLAAEASGVLTFSYEINDGRDGVARANVTITVRGPEENSPPVQTRATSAAVEAGGRVTTRTLGDWVDPDGDSFYLSEASVSDPDGISFTPEGNVTFTDAGTGPEAKSIGLSVSDGRATGTGSIAVTVKPDGIVPIVTDTFVVLASVGTEVSISPLEHARGGSAPLRLGSVPSKPNATLTADFDGGTFRFVSAQPGTHYVDYAVTDGTTTANGQVRIDVSPTDDSNVKPVTVPHTAFARTQRSTLVNVLAGDFDPAGGVLLVTGTSNVPADSGIRVEILEQRTLRVTLTKPVDGGSAVFNYTVSNGLSEATGSVTVMQIPEPLHAQAPIAKPDTISVRVGQVIDIPVLDNDEHPDGDLLTLNSTLTTQLPAESGLLFTSGNVLRYLAPNKPGNFTAVYQVDAPDGQFATGEVTISVRESDPASNHAPVPKTVTARVLAGERVIIPIPLTGIDADGDSVQLLGQETNPQKGAVTNVGTSSIEYLSGDYSAGTDTFTYTVIDSLGARATGTIRIGIGQRLDGARNPIAVEDEVTARPGSTVSVRVLDNDSDPDGGTVAITSVIATGNAATAKVKNDFVVVAVPESEGRFGFIYEIQNERGGTSSNFLTVVVTADAPLSRPDAKDTVLALSDILDRTTIDVDVLANVFFADGSERDLGLSLLPGFADSARVTNGKKIEVTIADNAQIIPFTVTHPEDPSIVANAFIWVPGFNDALPQLRKGAPKLSVQSESALAIDINDFVVAAGGKTVTLADKTTVQATHSNGANLVVSDGKLSFTSEDRFFGPASISFEVTDGDTAAVGGPRTATIVLPITVTPRTNQPPTFTGAVIDFEPGQSKVIDLVKLTTYRYPDDLGQLKYTVLDPKPTGFSWTLDGQKLTVRASPGTQKGAAATLSIGVTDALNDGSSGKIDMRVVASTRPIAVPASDSAVVKRGQTTSIDVLANDNATNPFPDVPLRVVSVQGLDSSALPEGISVSPSADNSTLTVRVAADAAAVDATLQYQVADATSDPSRFAWGTVQISVQDKADPVTGLAVTGFADGTLTVSFNPGAFNNSPITAYEVTQIDAGSGASISMSECTATTCTVQTRGNGQANGVRISVAARNGVGLSDPTTSRATVWSDVIPAAPTGLASAPLDKGLRLSWATVPVGGGGTEVSSYVVTVNGVQQSEVSAAGAACTADRCSVEVGSLTNGAAATFSISARNGAYPALTTWNSSSGSGTPFGAPIAGSVSASGSVTDASVTVVWSPFDGNGDAITGYVVQRVNSGAIPGGAQACTVSSPAPGAVSIPAVGGPVLGQRVVGSNVTSAVFTGLTESGAEYNFVVWGYNRAGCVAKASGAVTVRPAVGTVTAQTGAMEVRGDTIDYHVTGISSNGAAEFVRYEIRAGEGSSVVPFAGTGWPRELLTQPWGAAVQFQLRGCTVWGECGAWSSTFTAPQPSLSISFTMSGLVYDETTGVFSWTGGPENGNNPATYTCAVRDDPASVVVADPATNTCTLLAPAPAGTVRLNITVTVGANTFIHSDDL
ncbi:Ig-like domain-containing protein [Leifsonia sp. A12D58]|uniref:Ig-like domain-containing protein n=1 Tax=Leifsonia sp. A12D58 TaxID=3397674 RepID=UPI0039E01FEE